MIRISGVLLTACLTALPMTARADSGSPASDRAYCEKLVVIYVRYIGHDNDNAQDFLFRGSNDAQVASTQCQTNTASAIRVLERQLVDNKFTLPTHD
jgi:hypothetical protein